jgi:hypothetical protein
LGAVMARQRRAPTMPIFGGSASLPHIDRTLQTDTSSHDALPDSPKWRCH